MAAPAMGKRMWDQLANAINLRSSQDQVLCTITGIFSAANAVLLVALLFVVSHKTASPVAA